MPYHAFFSQKQKDYHRDINSIITNIRRYCSGIPISYNYINNDNKLIEVTCIYDTNRYQNYYNCPLIYDDKIYLGIVEKLHSTCTLL